MFRMPSMTLKCGGAQLDGSKRNLLTIKAQYLMLRLRDEPKQLQGGTQSVAPKIRSSTTLFDMGNVTRRGHFR